MLCFVMMYMEGLEGILLEWHWHTMVSQLTLLILQLASRLLNNTSSQPLVCYGLSHLLTLLSNVVTSRLYVNWLTNIDSWQSWTIHSLLLLIRVLCCWGLTSVSILPLSIWGDILIVYLALSPPMITTYIKNSKDFRNSMVLWLVNLSVASFLEE